MKYMTVSIISLVFMALLVTGCSGVLGGRSLTVTGGSTPKIECMQGESKITIDKEALAALKNNQPTGAELVTKYSEKLLKEDGKVSEVKFTIKYLSDETIKNIKSIATECDKLLDGGSLLGTIF